MISLKYRVENAQVVTRAKAVEVDGQQAVLLTKRLSVELLPVDHASGTVTLDLAPDEAGFAEGSEITLQVGAPE